MDLVGINEKGQPEQIAQDLRLEIAVPLAFGVTFVEPFQPFHDQLRAAGVELVESVATSG